MKQSKGLERETIENLCVSNNAAENPEKQQSKLTKHTKQKQKMLWSHSRTASCREIIAGIQLKNGWSSY